MPDHVCRVCGGTLEGDGYTLPRVCENAEADTGDREPDAPVLYCTPEDTKEREA